MRLVGKTILITGASRGIGAATAISCKREGAQVILHASRPSEAAERVTAECLGAGEGFLFHDLAEKGAGAALFRAALGVADHIDGVVNNAGVYLPSPLKEVEPGSDGSIWASNWETTMAINVQAPADICKAAIAHFRSREEGRKGGTIVNIASRAGHRGDGPDHAAYAASKGAVLAMTKSWARGLSGEGIHLYALAPGWVETRMAPEDIENRKKALAEIPLGRVADPAEIAEMTAFLLSGACPSAVGATIDINGASYVR